MHVAAVRSQTEEATIRLAFSETGEPCVGGKHQALYDLARAIAPRAPSESRLARTWEGVPTWASMCSAYCKDLGRRRMHVLEPLLVYLPDGEQVQARERMERSENGRLEILE